MTVLQPEVRPYLDRVRAALADLPSTDRDDLLEDLEGHLAEVAVDAGADLEERLGPPETYAAELRASAGLPARSESASSGRTWRERVSDLRAQGLDLPGVRATAEFLPDLRPGWWVLRGWLVVAVVAVLLGDPSSLARFPLVRVGGSLVLGLLVTAAAVVASVRVGRAPRLRWGPLVATANVLLLVAGVAAADVVRQQYGVTRYAMASDSDPYRNVLRGPHGPINNLYAYDSLGRPLFDVQLYDQSGNPVSDLLLQTPDGRFTRPQYLTSRDGLPLRNVFPRSYTVDTYGPDGRPSTGPLAPPSIAATPLPPKPSPAPSARRRQRRRPRPRPRPRPPPDLWQHRAGASPERRAVIAPGSGHPTDLADETTPVARSAAEVVRLSGSAPTLDRVDARSSVCRACPRLVAWREEVAANPRASFAGERYWGRPITGWGDPRPKVVVVGLAPAAHGGNRTGRIFTGDRSGDWLFAALHRAGLAASPTSTSADDGQQLISTRITLPVRCAPPANKPTVEERDTCAPWLHQELRFLLPTARAFVVLGGFGWASLWSALRGAGAEVPARPPAFGHGREVLLPGGATVIGCYHVSQQNTFTGRLTEAMLDEVFARARTAADLS